ncbi:MAG: hypothetical protein HKN78_02105 [Sphingomonadaceae bacterium]|nr:hypothetical protein [Sphingomonadaceae bacterium]
MTDYFIGAIIACLAIAGWASWMDRRRNKRDDLDRVGWVNWPLVLVLSLVAALIFTILAFAA